MGKEGKQTGFSTRWHSVASPSAGTLRELCRLLLPPGFPLSLLWCGAGSFPLPQAALAISPELCSDSCHLTFFSTYRLGKQQQVLWEGIGHPVEDFAFNLRRCVSAHRGCLWQNSLCFQGTSPEQGLMFNCFAAAAKNTSSRWLSHPLRGGAPLLVWHTEISSTVLPGLALP